MPWVPPDAMPIILFFTLASSYAPRPCSKGLFATFCHFLEPSVRWAYFKNRNIKSSFAGRRGFGS
jgi:hypothetical protein